MDIGIGLPNAVAGTTGRELVDWARKAEERGFSSLGTIDRLVYPSYDPFVALSAAAAVTERIKLLTAILITPPRRTAVVAKQAASLHALSEGRLVLGVGLGGRNDDYSAAGIETKGRGARLEEQLDELRRIWSGEERGFAGPIGPVPDSHPELIVGGAVEASFKRVAKYGDGWIMGGGTPDQLAEGAAAVEAAWAEAGREGKPSKRALAYFALGPDATEHAKKDLEHYYAWLGDETAEMISSSAATSQEMVSQYIAAFEQAGCDELVLFPANSHIEQVNLLADALGM